MNDDMMFEYLVQMGQMRPEEAELKKKQAMVDALRKGAMTPMQGEMVGKHYVSPGIAGALSQLGQGYMAAQAQGGVDQQVRGMNDRQRMALEELRRRRKPGGMAMDTQDYGSEMPGSGY